MSNLNKLLKAQFKIEVEKKKITSQFHRKTKIRTADFSVGKTQARRQ